MKIVTGTIFGSDWVQFLNFFILWYFSSNFSTFCDTSFFPFDFSVLCCYNFAYSTFAHFNSSFLLLLLAFLKASNLEIDI